MSWLDDSATDLVKNWIRRTAVPMLATDVDGTIFWCNGAFENLIDYTSAEIHSETHPITWTALTVDGSDLVNDQAMAEAVKAGHRLDYQLMKQYRTKGGNVTDVLVHAMRYPLTGDYKCCLVSIYPIRHGTEFALQELRELRVQMLTVVEHVTKPEESEMLKFLEWSDKNPKKAAFLVLFFSSLLFGDRVINTFKAIIAALKDIP